VPKSFIRLGPGLEAQKVEAFETPALKTSDAALASGNWQW